MGREALRHSAHPFHHPTSGDDEAHPLMQRTGEGCEDLSSLYCQHEEEDDGDKRHFI
jgi:hypothetical protein